MYTVLIIYVSPKTGVTSYGVRYFENLEEAQVYRTAEIEWHDNSKLYSGKLTADEAIAEYMS